MCGVGDFETVWARKACQRRSWRRLNAWLDSIISRSTNLTSNGLCLFLSQLSKASAPEASVAVMPASTTIFLAAASALNKTDTSVERGPRKLNKARRRKNFRRRAGRPRFVTDLC